MAYPAAAGITSILWRRTGRGFSKALLSAGLGDLLILVSGATWLAAINHAVRVQRGSWACWLFCLGMH